MKPMPAPKRLLSKLAVFDREERLTSPGDRVLIALSGGPDSVCLAHHLARLAKRQHMRLHAVYFHHGLRGKAADRDARHARRTAERLGIEFLLEALPVAETARRERRSLEDAARKLRYRALGRLARRLSCNKAAAGHQLDDQAETLILHLLRGTKAKGLGGIPPKRRLRESAPKVLLIRPLLALSRAEVGLYLKAYGLSARKDETNDSERFTRNWVRRKVLPLLARHNPRIRENLAALSSDIRRLIQR
ncbi:MAG: tRNA lysidine(34) synthetase TilS [Elusimicrobiota bacterium]